MKGTPIVTIRDNLPTMLLFAERNGMRVKAQSYLDQNEMRMQEIAKTLRASRNRFEPWIDWVETQ